MGRFNSGPGGIELETGFMTETDILDRFIGNRLWMSGNNTFGQLADSTRVHRSSPVQVVGSDSNWKSVSIGFRHAAALKANGSLWTMGININGQLGTASVVHRSSPVQTVSGGSNWQEVACGYNHTTAIKTDGTLWTWGWNAGGQLGDSTTTSRSSPVQTSAGGTNWKLVACGVYHTVALKTDGTVWSWGRNTNGQLGTNNIVHRSSPVQTVAGGTNWKYINSGYNHIAGLKTDGTLWLWGLNTDGQLGDGTVVHRSSPVQVLGGSSLWIKISAGLQSTSGIKIDGTLWSWGNNTDGQLGDGTSADKSSPVQTISGGTNWKEINNGLSTMAIKTDGTLWVWGVNTQGQLRDGTRTHRSSPVQTLAGGNNWKSVFAGETFTAAITFAEG